MADAINGCPTNADFKEAVCIDAGRVYDSCCDRDCLEDLRVYFTAENQECVQRALSVRIKSAEVANVLIDVEPVNFNRGFYSCDLTFFFIIGVEVFTSAHCCPTEIKGIAIFNKKVILFGSDGNVSTFSNYSQEEPLDKCGKGSSNSPRCVVQAVDPIALSSRLGVHRDCYENVGIIPSTLTNYLGGPVVTDLEKGCPAVYVTLGLFTIVQLIRNVQMLVPVYDFCIPEKQCDNTADQPCDIFRRIKFPTDDFFPPRPCSVDKECGCGCSDNSCDE